METKNEILPIEIKDKKLLDMMAVDSEQYVETMSSEEMAMPRIALLQSLSKVCLEGESEYIQGAKAGYFLNTLTSECFKSFHFIPCLRKIVYIEKTPRPESVFVKNWGEDPAVYVKAIDDGKGGHTLENGNEIVKTYEFYGLVVNLETGKCEPVLFSLSRTKVKKCKKWNSYIFSLRHPTTNKQAPEYAGLYEIVSCVEQHDNKKYHNIEPIQKGFVLGLEKHGCKFYEEAKKFHLMLKENVNKVKVDYSDNSDEFIDTINEERI